MAAAAMPFSGTQSTDVPLLYKPPRLLSMITTTLPFPMSPLLDSGSHYHRHLPDDSHASSTPSSLISSPIAPLDPTVPFPPSISLKIGHGQKPPFHL